MWYLLKTFLETQNRGRDTGPQLVQRKRFLHTNGNCDIDKLGILDEEVG